MGPVRSFGGPSAVADDVTTIKTGSKGFLELCPKELEREREKAREKDLERRREARTAQVRTIT